MKKFHVGDRVLDNVCEEKGTIVEWESEAKRKRFEAIYPGFVHIPVVFDGEDHVTYWPVSCLEKDA